MDEAALGVEAPGGRNSLCLSAIRITRPPSNQSPDMHQFLQPHTSLSARPWSPRKSTSSSVANSERPRSRHVAAELQASRHTNLVAAAGS